jgi:hypothetical protein
LCPPYRLDIRKDRIGGHNLSQAKTIQHSKPGSQMSHHRVVRHSFGQLRCVLQSFFSHFQWGSMPAMVSIFLHRLVLVDGWWKPNSLDSLAPNLIRKQLDKL